MPITTTTTHTTSGRDSPPVTEPARPVGGARLLMLRWLAGRCRVTGVAVAAAGWAPTFAAVIAGSGHLGRAAAAQIGLAAAMIISAMGEALLSPAVPVIIEGRDRPGAAGRYKRPSTRTLVTGCTLGLPAGGAALGAGWGTSLLTTLAVACALASIAAQRLGRQLAPGASRVPVAGAHPVADHATSR